MDAIALQEQNRLGWHLDVALERLISHRWGEEQDAIWKAFKSQKSGQWWTTALIQRLLDTVWDMRQHCNNVMHNSPENQAAILDAEVNQELQEL